MLLRRRWPESWRGVASGRSNAPVSPTRSLNPKSRSARAPAGSSIAIDSGVSHHSGACLLDINFLLRKIAQRSNATHCNTHGSLTRYEALSRPVPPLWSYLKNISSSSEHSHHLYVGSLREHVYRRRVEEAVGFTGANLRAEPLQIACLSETSKRWQHQRLHTSRGRQRHRCANPDKRLRLAS